MEHPNFTAPAWWSTWTRDNNFLFLFLNLDSVFSNSTRENFANIWQIEWDWLTAMKIKTMRIQIFRFGWDPEILPPWQHDVTTSLLYRVQFSIRHCFLQFVNNSLAALTSIQTFVTVKQLHNQARADILFWFVANHGPNAYVTVPRGPASHHGKGNSFTTDPVTRCARAIVVINGAKVDIIC